MNVHGDTPLHIAARQNHAHAVYLLIVRGARVDCVNAKGQTPIDTAIQDSEVYRLLNVNHQLRQVSGL